MTPIVFNRNSWHAQLARFVTAEYVLADTNICHYMRRVFWGVVAVLTLIFFGSMAVVGQIEGLWYLLVSVYTWTLEDMYAECWYSLPAIIMLGVDAIFATLGVCGLLWAATTQYLIPQEGIVPSFVKESYRSIKDKVCFKVTLS